MIALYLAKCTKQTEHSSAKALAEYGFKDCFGRTAVMSHDKRGKPYFIGEPSAFVSVSHSEGICLAAIADCGIGADVEYMKNGDERLIRLAKRYFTSDEADYVMADPYPRFYEIWCKKESYIKYTGEGLSRKLGSFSVLDAADGDKKLIFTSLMYDSFTVAVCAEEAVTEPPTLVDNSTITQ